MTKREFLNKLGEKLYDLPKDDVSERIDFYSEMIDDKIEEGLAEEEAVLSVGAADDIAEQIRDEISSSRFSDNHNEKQAKVCSDDHSDGSIKKKSKNKRKMKTWEIVLLAAGSPLWLVLIISAAAVIFSLYAVIWSVVVSLWAIFASFVGCSVGFLAGGIILVVLGNITTGLVLIGGSIACAGLSIFAFFGCRESTKGVAKLTKFVFNKIFRRRENDED